MTERFTLPPLITSSSWSTAWQSLWEQSRRGMTRDDEGTIAPAWTNREAAAVVWATRRAAPDRFPLWYQFAAVAYGWQPDGDKIDATQQQADRMYPADASVQLNLELQRIAADLDEAGAEAPRLELADVFEEPDRIRDVTAALRQDGARASFKIPLPACKDPATGRPARPVYSKERRKWECPGGVVTIDDPITAIAKTAGPLALLLGLAYVLIKIGPRRTRRTSKPRRVRRRRV